MEFREREFGISHEGGFQVLVARLRERERESRKRKILTEQRNTLWVGGGDSHLDSPNAVFYKVYKTY